MQKFEEFEEARSSLSDWREALIPTLVHAKNYEEREARRGGSGGGGGEGDGVEEVELEPEWTEVVRFSDCDPLGHLNNAKYLEYFVHARDMHLKNAYHVDLTEHALKYNETWVVKEHRIAYLRPVRVKETIRIRTRLLDFTENSTFVESLIFDERRKRIKAFLWSRFAYIHIKTGKTAVHPDFITKILKKTKIDERSGGLVGDSEGHFDFESRLKDVLLGVGERMR